MKAKVTYIISNIDKAIAFEWLCEEINNSKFELNFILLNNQNSYLEEYLIYKKISVNRVNYGSKADVISAIFKTCYLLNKYKTDIVHTHLFDATFVGLIASKLCGIKKRIYTRHYSDYHHHYFPNSVKWDKLNNYNATQIIAISNIVRDVLIVKEKVNPSKISVIHHGFKLDDFSNKNSSIIEALKAKYNILHQEPVIGVISRFTKLKGIQYIIPAFKQLLKIKPNARLLLFNATGDYAHEIDKLLIELPVTSYQKVRFEGDITSIYHIFDLFIHVPINSTIEAFGQTYIECMASGVPLIATKSGIANEILNGNNAVIVPHRNSEAIYNSMLLLLNNKLMKDDMVKNAHITVNEKFSFQNMIEKLENIYLN